MLDKRLGATNVLYGPELITNGSFDNAANWIILGTWQIGGGVAFKTVTDNNPLRQNLGSTTVENRSYRLTYTQTTTSGTLGSRLQGATVTNLDPTGASGIISKIIVAPRLNVNNEIFLEFIGGAWVGSIDNVSLREILTLNGSHAIQPNQASRPTLEARYNRLVATEQFGAAAWTATDATVADNIGDVAAPNGTFTASTITATAPNATVTQPFSVAITDDFTFSVYMRRRTGTGNVGIQTGNNVYTTVTLTADWQRLSVAANVTTGTQVVGIQLATSGDAVDVWGAQLDLEPASLNNAPLPYQRVTTATDYEDVGYPRYLLFDGVDDLLTSQKGVSGLLWSISNGMGLIAWVQADGFNNTSRRSLFGVSSLSINYYETAIGLNGQYWTNSTSLRNASIINLTVGNSLYGAGIPGQYAANNLQNVSIRRPNLVVNTTYGNALRAQEWRYFNNRFAAFAAEKTFNVFDDTLTIFTGNLFYFVGATATGPNRFWGGLTINRGLTENEQQLCRQAFVAKFDSTVKFNPILSW
jgi:hypothetical protein